MNVIAACFPLCVCIAPSPPAHLAQAEIPAFYEEVAWSEATDVFAGTVVRAEVIAWQPLDADSIVHLEAGDTLLAEFDVWRLQPVRVRFTLVVADVWKGTIGEEITVVGSTNFTSCDRLLALGESYVIYARRSEGTVFVGSCTRAVRRSEAGLELAALARRRVEWR